MTHITRRALFAGTALALTLAGAAQAQDHTFRIQSSDPAGNTNFLLQKEWAEMVSDKTDGRVAVEMLPVETIVAHSETMDAVAAGIIDGHFTDTSYASGKDPAFGLIANPVGAWSDPAQMFDFMANGGGNALMNEMLEPYGLHFIGATTPGLEAFVSTVPLDGVDDLKGLKLRAPEGMVQNVFAAAGAAPVNLPGSEVFTSLDKGVIDAADYNTFSTNAAQGLHDVARHPVYPGFHSMPLIEVSVNKEKWDSLPDDLKAAMEESVAEFAVYQSETVHERDMQAASEAEASGEVTIHDWSDEERAKFRAIARSQWEDAAGASANSQKVYDLLTAYLVDKGLMSED
ncbi:C4-dicarboxylate ABC transporter substrate-binding protein [Salipiger aestuarii]|uniref:TRAP-type C4-dicarboxylate transport system substrate-binding protein n=1 Tax=Salipiger aestuarii TaxID=568098 RepID=A0A327Y5L5_9RHOB|nr:TRAP transporter substrate-binding protein [Salipiger aestuarii]EIE50618.1 TRAP dicarboxylate family transporter DctP subunit [Citreicella sp. 357]KAA8607755.1 C4-dicarboxylate ABC transporter substrate-binding protein [Salipiger aestuarii]KAA8609425.1 C4-dicarboxylate ABC transporter substrate-binding protein [Salipiger aestuarii]KAB2542020.1 C4-dicarboxylate ABC transporter substrate-binding protein [Salipiger aestuarii]RAK15582.1 TRAP-type C4-dicarboxylate transport system substrate-bind